MFFRHKNREVNPEHEAEYRNILRMIDCEEEVKRVMKSSNMEWEDLLLIVKGLK